MKMWYRNIIYRKREEIKQVLTDKLFLIDDTFGTILMKHRLNCKQMETLRVITLTTPGVDVANMSEFLAAQEKQRSIVTRIIVEKSAASRLLFNTGMKEVIENLRKKVVDLNELED